MLPPNSNGHNGNVPAPDNQFTFSTGITVKLQRVSPYLLAEIRRAYLRPDIPMQEVDYGESKRLEPNPIHPDYISALSDYERLVQNAGAMELIQRGVILDETEVRDTVSKLRQDWLTRYQSNLSEEDDRMAYIKYVCIGSTQDLSNLLFAINRLSHPTEAAIAETTANFRGALQGP